MAIIGVSGWQGKGKTILGRIILDEIIAQGHSSSMVGNLHVKPYTDESNVFHPIELLSIPSAYFKSLELISYIQQMIPKRQRNTIVFIDEADRVFPARFWENKTQSIALIGCWQDEKMSNDFIYTYHASGGVDKILRVATGIEIKILQLDIKSWSLLIEIQNWREGIAWQTVVKNINAWFPKYNRWEVVV